MHNVLLVAFQISKMLFSLTATLQFDSTLFFFLNAFYDLQDQKLYMWARCMLPDIDLISMVWLHVVFRIFPVSILPYNIGSLYLVHSEYIPPDLIFLFMVNWRCEIYATFQLLDQFHHYNTRRVLRYQRGNQNPYIDLQDITQKTKDRATRHLGWTQVLRKSKQLLLRMWHMSCYSYIVTNPVLSHQQKKDLTVVICDTNTL
jgi:hypothetical protein